MSTKIIVIILIIIGVAGVGGYIAWSRPAADTSTDTAQSADVTSDADTDKKIAFTELIKQGGTYKCTVKQYVGDMSSEGIVYLDKDRMRAEYASNVQGMNITSNIIVRDGYSYAWSSAMPSMGYKMKINAEANASNNANANASGSYSFNAETIGDYNCEAWVADASRFELPSGVTFKEM